MIKKIFGILSILYVLVYLLSCLTPFVHPAYFAGFTFLSLGFPILLAGMIVLIITWFFIYKRTAIIFFIVLLLGWKNIFSSVAFRLPQDFVWEKDTNALRVLSWNVRDFENCSITGNDSNTIRTNIFRFIEQSKADLICLQDFVEIYNGKAFFSNFQWMDSLGYKYVYATNDYTNHMPWGDIQKSAAIFSNMPIINSGKYFLPNTIVPESIGFADIVWANKKMRIYNTHFQSMFLFSDTVKPEAGVFKNKQDSVYIYSTSKWKKLIRFDTVHAAQAIRTKAALNKSSYPFIFCADMNSVPANFTYHQISKGLQDAFLQKGSGLGQTYKGLSPTLRIDYILASPQFTIQQFYCPQLELSDHFPLITDIKWKE